MHCNLHKFGKGDASRETQPLALALAHATATVLNPRAVYERSASGPERWQ